MSAQFFPDGTSGCSVTAMAKRIDPVEVCVSGILRSVRGWVSRGKARLPSAATGFVLIDRLLVAQQTPVASPELATSPLLIRCLHASMDRVEPARLLQESWSVVMAAAGLHMSYALTAEEYT